jgi:hypothetical protein
MIFVPGGDHSLSDICRELPDGFYGLPRFELPEWLWESLPRTDPRRVVAEIGRLGRELRLNEPTFSHEWIRFDAPGDFQLVLRDDFLSIDGFDEDMLLGYHVDSNLSRRLLLQRGSIESLEPHLAGYHCNHNRTRTVYHGARVENDLLRFFYSVQQPEVPAQRSTWGMPDVVLEEVPVREPVAVACAVALVEAIPPRPQVSSDAWGAPFSLSYDSGHVLPFIADTLVLSRPESTIGYVGANTVLERMLCDVVKRLGFERPVSVARFDDMASIEQIADEADVFVIDLGLDVTQRDPSLDATRESELLRFPPILARAPGAIDRLVDLERDRCEQGEHARPIVLVNSSGVWNGYVLAQFDCSYTTFHSRVRRANVKLLSEGDASAIEAELVQMRRVTRWYARDRTGEASVVIRPGESIGLADLPYYSGFGAGWYEPEPTGIWSRGETSEFKIRIDGIDGIDAGEHVLTVSIGMICIAPPHALRVELLVNGDHLATRRFTDSAGRPWRVDLPATALRDGELELTLNIDAPRSPVELGWSSDDRRLGIHLQTLALERIDRSLPLGQRVEFRQGFGGQRLLADGWSWLEPTGVSSVDETARLAFRVLDGATADIDIVLELVPLDTGRHADIEVEVWSHGQRLAARVLRPAQPPQSLRARLPDAALGADRAAVLELRLRDAAGGVETGHDRAARPPGVQLRALTVVDASARTSEESAEGMLAKLRKHVSQSLRS